MPNVNAVIGVQYSETRKCKINYTRISDVAESISLSVRPNLSLSSQISRLSTIFTMQILMNKCELTYIHIYHISSHTFICIRFVKDNFIAIFSYCQSNEDGDTF